MIVKCLKCRGMANAGLLPTARQVWPWRSVTIKRKVAYHYVQIRGLVAGAFGHGKYVQCETACGLEFLEEDWQDY